MTQATSLDRTGDDWLGFGLRGVGALAYVVASVAAAKVLGEGNVSPPVAVALVVGAVAPAFVASLIFERQQRRRDELEKMQQVRAAYLAGLFTVGFAFGQAAYRALDAYGLGDGDPPPPIDTQLALPAIGCLAWLICARFMRMKYR